MIKKYNQISLATGVPGFLMQIIGRVMMDSRGGGEAMGVLLTLVGTVLFMTGLAYYAKAKGRSGWWCLMAFLSLIGFIVLALLEDRAPEGEKPSISKEELNKFD